LGPLLSPYTDGIASFGYGPDGALPYPFSVKVDKPLALSDVFRIVRSSFPPSIYLSLFLSPLLSLTLSLSPSLTLSLYLYLHPSIPLDPSSSLSYWLLIDSVVVMR
jgi:hypothetical protein